MCSDLPRQSECGTIDSHSLSRIQPTREINTAAVQVYVCQMCGAEVPSGTSCRRVVVETREKIYPKRDHAIRKPGRQRKDWKTDPGGIGREIVRELMVCPSCAQS